MFKPTGDLIFVEVLKRYEGILMPDNSQPGQGDIFKVVAVGDGMYTEYGVLIKPSVEVGDIVYLMGKLVSLPIEDGKILVARSSDVLAYERAEKGSDAVNGSTDV